MTVQLEGSGRNERVVIRPGAIYNVPEAADALHISPRQLRKIVKRGELRRVPYSVGKFLFAGEELLQFVGATRSEVGTHAAARG